MGAVLAGRRVAVAVAIAVASAVLTSAAPSLAAPPAPVGLPQPVHPIDIGTPDVRESPIPAASVITDDEGHGWGLVW